MMALGRLFSLMFSTSFSERSISSLLDDDVQCHVHRFQLVASRGVSLVKSFEQADFNEQFLLSGILVIPPCCTVISLVDECT